MIEYTKFAQGNPTIIEDIDLVDYLWQTASIVVEQESERWPEAMKLRKAFFDALDSLPEQGPTFEDACLFERILPISARESKYVTAEMEKKHYLCEVFFPLGSNLFYDMVMYQTLRSLSQDEINNYLDQIAKNPVNPHPEYVLEDIFNRAGSQAKDQIRAGYKSWRERELCRSDVVREELRDQSQSKALVERLVRDHGFDFGQFQIGEKLISNGLHNMNVVANKYFQYLK